MTIVFIINQNRQNIGSVLMQSRMGPPGHRPRSNKKEIIKIGPYAEEFCGDKYKTKYIGESNLRFYYIYIISVLVLYLCSMQKRKIEKR